MVSSERGPAEPRSMYSRSRRKTVKLKGNTVDTALSSCTSSKLSETAYFNVDTGSLEWVGSGLGLRLSPVGATTYTESGNLHSTVLACHTRSKLSKTVKR